MNGGLASAVQDPATLAGIGGHPGAQVDDAAAPLLHHHRQHGPAAVVGSANVDPQDLVPAGGVYLHDRLPQHHLAGVVEQHVDPAVPFHCAAHHVVDLLLIGDVAVDGQDFSAAVSDVRNRFLEGAGEARWRLAPGANDDAGTLPGILPGNGPAQSTACAGDDCDHSVHLTHNQPCSFQNL